MNILITGGAGFIGANLTEELLKQDCTVTIFDNFNPYYNPEYKRANIKSFARNTNFHCIKGDITDKELLIKVFKERTPNKVIHLAASVGVRNSIEHPEVYVRNNVEGAKNILEMVGLHGVKHFLFASSSSIYGNNSPTPFEEDNVVDSPLSPYAQTKKDGEVLCFDHHKKFNTQVTIFRFFTVYGPKGRPDMAPYIFTESILKEKKVSIFGDGTAKRDFTYISDLVDGIILGIEKEFSFEIFNLGSSSPVEIKTFIEKIEKITEKKAQLEYKDRFLTEMRDTYANIEKARKLLGYNPRVTLNEGLEVFVQWFRENRL